MHRERKTRVCVNSLFVLFAENIMNDEAEAQTEISYQLTTMEYTQY